VKLEPCQQSGMLRTLILNVFTVLDLSMNTSGTVSEGCVNTFICL